MPSQYDRREERDVEPSDRWFYFWVCLVALGVALYVLVDSTVGIAVAVLGVIGFVVLARLRGVLAWPDGGGTLP